MLDRLNRNERIALMELLYFLAKADGRIPRIESEVLDQYGELLEVEPNEITGDYNAEELVPQFESAASRVIVLQELFRLSHLNGKFTDNEQSVILDIASLMGVPMELLRQIEQWVIEGFKWNLRGEELIDEASRAVRLER